MEKKQAFWAMMGLIMSTSTGCTTILDIDYDYTTQVVLADRQNHPVYIAVDANNVYWTNRGNLMGNDGSVMQVPIDGGTPIILADVQAEPRCIAVDTRSVYWTNFADGTVMKVPIYGGTPIMPTIIAPGQNKPYDIFVFDGFVYWTNEGPDSKSTDGAVMRRKLDDESSPVESLAAMQQYPQSIAMDATNLFWTSAKSVTKAKHDGNIVDMQFARLNPTDTAYSRIAVYDTSVYWTSTDEGVVKKVPMNGGEDPRTLATVPTPFGIVVDGTSVYWTSASVGDVWKVGIDGGTGTKLAEHQGKPTGIALDEKFVYWANDKDGTVMKAAK